MDSIKREVVLTDSEVQGLDRMRELNEEYLANNKCSDEVRQFLEKAGADNDYMLLYLKARKYRPEHAWETLKKKAEVRFVQYPEVFVQKPAEFHEEIQKLGMWGILKNKDKLGRRIICVHGCTWDTNVHKIVDLTNSFIQLTEKLLLDEDAVENGVVMVMDVDGMGLNHAQHFGLNVMLRLINTLWVACPLKIKGVYFPNVPFYLTFLYDVIKSFLPKKLKERISITGPSKKYTALHATVDKKILPEYLGGSLEYSEAFEFVKF